MRYDGEPRAAEEGRLEVSAIQVSGDVEWLRALDATSDAVAKSGRQLASVGCGEAGWSRPDTVVRTLLDVERGLAVLGAALVDVEGTVYPPAAWVVRRAAQDVVDAGWRIARSFAGWSRFSLEEGGEACASFSNAQSAFTDVLGSRVSSQRRAAAARSGQLKSMLLGVATVVLAQARVVAAATAALELDQHEPWDEGFLDKGARSVKRAAIALFVAGWHAGDATWDGRVDVESVCALLDGQSGLCVTGHVTAGAPGAAASSRT